ncbi:hypothetical protein AJ80_03188 [Polytolypa hystricis UAMH7299]|uniref:14-3-3 domain-containing protein n=1 Tax=Polytolypa hystricis (strain UAMH7299) TaxID=1447883 RepID=A0A2B7YK08_POLH7|nr:hypothetical protein AJ80_03188 [Polytolypa hystricis UAMH7299]
MASDLSFLTPSDDTPTCASTRELIILSRQWHDSESPAQFAFWMASSEVDQKFLGHFATSTSRENPFLSSMLYKILGLSVILSKKLLRARKLRRLDTTRETKSLQLYHHILWLSREGLIMVEQYVLPMVADYVELKVLAYKLRASFYHIFVLFHNQPSVHHSGIQSLPPSTSQVNLTNGTSGTSNGAKQTSAKLSPNANRASITASPPLSITPEGGPVGGVPTQMMPPGLGPVQPPKSAASFILPAMDYTPTATACFSTVALLADRLLPGSHPIRLSVKLEYAAYLYDCLNDSDGCRRLAKQAIADVYNAEEGMDDESFEDAADLVGILGKMVKRGGKTSSVGGSSTPGGEKSRSEGSRGTLTPGLTQQESGGTPRQRQQPRLPTTRGTPTKVFNPTGLSPAIPDPTMTNPI